MNQATQSVANLTYDTQNKYGLRCIPMTSKMIKRLERGLNSIILYSDLESAPLEELPQKGEFFFFGEKIIRQYGWSNGVNVLHTITYDSDGQIRLMNPVITLDEEVETISANGMLDNEARYYAQVISCRIRSFKSLKMAQVIHDNVYDLRKSDRVIVLRFRLVSYQEVVEACEKAKQDAFWEWLHEE